MIDISRHTEKATQKVHTRVLLTSLKDARAAAVRRRAHAMPPKKKEEATEDVGAAKCVLVYSETRSRTTSMRCDWKMTDWNEMMITRGVYADAFGFLDAYTGLDG
jgi:hypothetical protein